MKILIITQKIDNLDPVLGFFHDWVKSLAPHFEGVTVMCLQKGSHSLPLNVNVLSLGKEENASRFSYLHRFYTYIIRERKKYDAVFVHMNQEYVLLGFPIWGVFGKYIFMWRNHPAGNILTSTAVFLCDKTFCTSQFSYIARFKKNELMPVGIDTNLFNMSEEKKERDILFLGRIAPIKRPDFLIVALQRLREKKVDFHATFVGSALPKDQIFCGALRSKVKELGLVQQVSFHEGVPNQSTIPFYRSHKICVNLSPSGMYDKTIFEAFASGSLCLSSNENLKGHVDPRLLFIEDSLEDLVQKIETLLCLSEGEYAEMQKKVREYTLHTHSLSSLVTKLVPVLKNRKERPFVGTLVKYLISGTIAASVDLFFLYFFTNILHIWYLASSVLAFLVAFGVSFSLQKFWAFKDTSTEKIKSQMALYFLITSFNLCLNTLLMYFFVSSLHVPYFIAQMISGGLVAMQSFFSYQKFVFKK